MLAGTVSEVTLAFDLFVETPSTADTQRVLAATIILGVPSSPSTHSIALNLYPNQAGLEEYLGASNSYNRPLFAHYPPAGRWTHVVMALHVGPPARADVTLGGLGAVTVPLDPSWVPDVLRISVGSMYMTPGPFGWRLRYDNVVVDAH